MASEDKNSGAGDKKPTYLQMSLDAIKEDNSKGGTSKQVYRFIISMLKQTEIQLLKLMHIGIRYQYFENPGWSFFDLDIDKNCTVN